MQSRNHHLRTECIKKCKKNNTKCCKLCLFGTDPCASAQFSYRPVIVHSCPSLWLSAHIWIKMQTEQHCNLGLGMPCLISLWEIPITYWSSGGKKIAFKQQLLCFTLKNICLQFGPLRSEKKKKKSKRTGCIKSAKNIHCWRFLQYVMLCSILICTHSHMMNNRCQNILALFAIAVFLHFPCVLYTFIMANKFLFASGINTEKGMEMILGRDFLINSIFFFFHLVCTT